ncbi:hypothetical protein [Kroppenstedtia eburnea]|uniref:Uncharacterized protein n=1 Tax=Kroppenstedtia eburnea TaxID=714067 RepID=A0A1N7LX10_9BACL|nr:hypothetical protein [Kroppenstedtia eburnea]QKI81684.1 hypothetical protein GXN75_06570 [Kroppenstedtia eburnea]SIS78241.1 hypothetical protein SAMN05421790_10534 [Kroppenstedtia eburnea]
MIRLFSKAVAGQKKAETISASRCTGIPALTTIFYKSLFLFERLIKCRMKK